ncbi:MAG: diadenylate cyclase CdaA [Bryobacteraceae bacterium]
MRHYLTQLLDAMPRLSIRDVIDILLVALLIYQSAMIIRGRRAARIILGLGTVVAAYVVAVLTGLEMVRAVLEAIAPYTAFALIVMFQSELRRMLARLGERPWMSVERRFQTREVGDEIMLAAGHLAQHSVGALIVLEGDIGLRSFIESGVALDARVTRDLLLAIFQPGGALHDGAVIVQNDRIAAAACFLPLTMNPQLSSKLGTRHRAAIGVTEESDCLAVVVSEERGAISLASGGEIELDVSMERLAERLKHPFAQRGRIAPAESRAQEAAEAPEVRP